MKDKKVRIKDRKILHIAHEGQNRIRNVIVLHGLLVGVNIRFLHNP